MRVRNQFAIASVALLCLFVAGAQTQAPHEAADNRVTAASSSHDLSGVWLPPDPQALDRLVGYNNRGAADGAFAKEISRTPWADEKYNAARPGFGPRRAPGGNDPILHCDPPGMPRIMGGAFEMIRIPDRIVLFFESNHVRREIWMDGRDLPKDPDPTWYGYSVGKWEGDTLVVNTTGFNDRSWIDSWGDPHSDEMHVVERYRRLDHDTLELRMTIDDPKAYKNQLVSDPKIFKLHKKYDLVESLCAPEDEASFLEKVREPAMQTPNK